MDLYKIRELIAESGSLKISEIVRYFQRLHPSADLKVVKREAKQMISESKKYI